MKRFFTILFFVSSAPSTCMEITKSKDSTILLQAFTREKELFPVPHHIAQLCKTLQNPLTDLEQTENNIIFPTSESPTTIKATLACLSLAHELYNLKNKTLHERKFEYFLSQFISNENTLVSITHFIHYLDPQDYFELPDENKTKKSYIQHACEKALLNSAIKAQSKKSDAFIALNPDLNPKNVSKFLKETSLISDILGKYIDRPLPKFDKKYLHPLLNKDDADCIEKILYCTDTKVIYAIKNQLRNDTITLACQTPSKTKYKNTSLFEVSIANTNDVGTILTFTENKTENNFHLYYTKLKNFFEYSKFSAHCISNENVYITHKGKIYLHKTNTVDQIHNIAQNPTITHLAVNMYDSVLACTTENYLYILKKTTERQAFFLSEIINLENLLKINCNSFAVEKISLHPNGKALYLVIKHSTGDSHDYIYDLQTENLLHLSCIPRNYTLSDMQWSSSFIIRAYSSNPFAKPMTHYTISHINTGKSYTKTINKPFLCLTRNGFAYIEKKIIDEKEIHYTVPLIDDGLELLGHFFENISSFTTIILIDGLIKNEKTVLSDYDYHLFEQFPAPLKNILTAQEKK